MTLSKAIEILADILRYVKPGDPPDEHDAVKIGLDAIKRVQHCRKWGYRAIHQPLFGEDPE